MPKELTHFNSNYFNSYIELTLNYMKPEIQIINR